VLNETGRIEPGKRDLAQLRLEIPVTAIPNDRFIIRSYSPQRTIGGGRVVDAMAAKHRQKDVNTVRRKLLDMLRADTARPELLGHFLDNAGGRGLSFAATQARTGWRKEILEKAIRDGIRTGSIVRADPFLLTSEHFSALKEATVSEVEKAHRDDPLSPGMMRETLRERVFGSIPAEIFQAVVSSLEADKILLSRKDTVGIAGRDTALSAEEAMLLDRLRKIYIDARLEVPKLDEALANSTERTQFQRPHARKIFQILLDSGELVKVTDEFYFSKPVVLALIERVRAEASGDRIIDVPAFKELAGVSRKYAIPLLEYFDREKVTLRKGDKRLIL
jgi:selenocysteine-specific elongation factor